MGMKARSGCHSFEDFCALVPNGQKADLIDGIIYIAPPDTTDVASLSGWVLTVVGLYVEFKKLGRVFSSRVAFRLNDQNAPEPDIAFVRRKHFERVRKEYIEGPPDLAMEFVTPDSVERDYEKKRKQYEWAGVSEYWIIDDEERNLLVLRLNSKGRYRKVRPLARGYRSEIMPGFRLDPCWLWQEPFPFSAIGICEKLVFESSAE